MALARTRLQSVARLATAAAAAGRRNMSGHGSPEEIYASKELWYKTSILVAGFVIIPYTAFVLYKESTHEHHDHAPVYAHMNQRHKGFPWTESDCPMFDLHCKKEWRAAHSGGKAAAAAHH